MKKQIVSVLLLLSYLITACSSAGFGLPVLAGSEKTIKQDAQSDSHPVAGRTLTVFAAASLTDAFQEIGDKFEAANPGVTVEFCFAGSQILRTQLEQGAVADVFSSADHKNMDLLVSENLVDTNSIQDFATNRLIVILPPGNPAGIETLQELSRAKLKIILADRSVPAGNYARQVITNLGTDPAYGDDFVSLVLGNVVSNETDVRQVVTKIELGEADAGFVYASDAIAASGLTTIAIPNEFNIIALYPIGILSTSRDPDLAAKFITYLLSPAGQAIMNKWGFSPGH